MNGHALATLPVCLVAAIPLLWLLWMAWVIGHNKGYRLAAIHLRKEIENPIKERYEKAIESDRMKLLTKGEQIGYEKGFEAGKVEAREQLRRDFIMFLEEQVIMLKNKEVYVPSLPNPKLEE